MRAELESLEMPALMRRAEEMGMQLDVASQDQARVKVNCRRGRDLDMYSYLVMASI